MAHSFVHIVLFCSKAFHFVNMFEAQTVIDSNHLLVTWSTVLFQIEIPQPLDCLSGNYIDVPLKTTYNNFATLRCQMICYTESSGKVQLETVWKEEGTFKEYLASDGTNHLSFNIYHRLTCADSHFLRW